MTKQRNESGSYLKKLRFDLRLSNSLVAKYISNPRLVTLLLLFTIIVGTASYLNLPRTVNPEIKIAIVLVTTVLPGASPTDVESLVTIPIEDAVSGLENVKTTTSSSRDSVSVTILEFESGVDAEKARTDVQGVIDTVELPEDAQTPRIQKLDFENEPIWTFAVTGRGSVASLVGFSKELSQKLKDLPEIGEVTAVGLEEQEIQITIKPETLASFAISPLSINQAIKASLSSIPGGVVKTETSSFALSIDPAVTSVSDIRGVQINTGGSVVSLSDIATIQQRSKPQQSPSYYASNSQKPSRSVTFYVFKSSGASINKSYNKAKDMVDSEVAGYHGSFTVDSLIDTGKVIEDQFNELLRDFWITVTLVFIVLFIFLGVRQALVASLSIPLTFLVSFTVMNSTGITLNFLSFFALLLSLGLLVDDTIVVISAMTAYYRTGKFTPLQTGLLVWRDFIAPIFTTTITTVWAFIPLLLSSGIIGEFIKPIPIVVSTTLLASLGVAMLITLPFLIILLKPQFPKRVVVLLRILVWLVLAAGVISIVPKNAFFFPQLIIFALFAFIVIQVRNTIYQRIRSQFQSAGTSEKRLSYLDSGLISFERLEVIYRRILTNILLSRVNRRKTIAMVVIFSFFSYLLFPLGFVKNEFFPKSENDYVFVTLELPSGTNIDATKKEAVVLQDMLGKTEGISYVVADVGRTFNSGSGFGEGDVNTVLYTMILPEKGKRKTSSLEISEDLRQSYKNYTKGNVQVVEVSGGPPAGSDLQIKLFGNDLKILDAYATRIQNYLKKQNGVTNIDKSIKPGTSKVVFVPDQQKLAHHNLTQDVIGLTLRTFASGFTADTIKLQNQDEDTDIVFRTNPTTQFIEHIGLVSVPTQTGVLPLSSLGSFQLKANPTLITREDGKRTLSVNSGVRPGFSVTTLNTGLEKFADSLNLPNGYSWKTGGINEENNKSVNSILQAMVLSFFLIITTIVIEFGSYRKSLIVMLVIPLSVAGVFIIFALTKTPLSFPALIGVLALFGIVVKNSILVVDKINQNIKAGIPFMAAIVDGSASRLEAIALTSLATIMGLTPITLSDPLWRGLGGSIIAGLAFSGTIMLFFIPVVYYLMFIGEQNDR